MNFYFLNKVILFFTIFIQLQNAMAADKSKQFRVGLKRLEVHGQLLYNKNHLQVQVMIPESCENPHFSIIDRNDTSFSHIYFVSLLIQKTPQCLEDLKQMTLGLTMPKVQFAKRYINTSSSSLVVFGRPARFNKLTDRELLNDDLDGFEEESALTKLIEELNMVGSYKIKKKRASAIYLEKTLYDYMTNVGSQSYDTLADAKVAMREQGRESFLKMVRSAGFLLVDSSGELAEDMISKNHQNNDDETPLLSRALDVIDLRVQSDGSAAVVGSIKPLLGNKSKVDISLTTPVELLHDGEMNFVASANHTAEFALTPVEKLKLSTFYNFCDANSNVVVGNSSNLSSCNDPNSAGVRSTITLFRDKVDDITLNLLIELKRDEYSDTELLGSTPSSGSLSFQGTF